MNRYYKIITDDSLFSNIYNMNKTIPWGTHVCDPYISLDTGWYWFVAPYHIHFAQGAFDTMLWYNELRGFFNKWFQIYEVLPLTKVIKARCRDEKRIFQCGAQEIMFLNQVRIDDIYEDALREYYANPDKKIHMYPNLPMNQVIDACKNHKRYVPKLAMWEQEIIKRVARGHKSFYV